MDKERITAILHIHSQNKKIDIDIPLDITANELIVSLAKGFNLNIDISNPSKCFLKTENPIALLRGNKLLRDYELRDGVLINITE
jgi:uncharacterized ubiquitin-like protein YukD